MRKRKKKLRRYDGQDSFLSTEGATHTWTEGIWSIQDLIDQCEKALIELEDNQWSRFSHLQPRELSIAKSVGPLIIDSSALGYFPELDADGSYTLDLTFGLPELIFMCLPSFDGDYDDPKKERPHSFCYCNRVTSLPVGVAPTGPGYAYMVSVWLSWRDEDPWRENHMYYCTVDPKTHKLWPCATKTVDTQVILGRRHGNKKRGSGRQKLYLQRPCWKVNPMWTMPWEEGRMSELAFVCGAFSYEMQRDQQWEFTMLRAPEHRRKYPLRATAALSPMLVKRLFKDRDKREYVMKNGRRRPILHWTRAHYRKIFETPQTWWQRWLWGLFPRLRPIKKTIGIRTHLRGLRRFHHSGHECEILVPGLHRKLVEDRGLTCTYIDGDPVPIIDDDSDEAIDAMLFKDFPKTKWYLGPQDHVDERGVLRDDKAA